jgi:tripartite-type tricarboxylate transporter receptor subunit TctC
MFTKTKNLSRIIFAVVSFITVLFLDNSFAQAPYPNKPITLIHPWVGGASDLAVREVIKEAAKELGQPINLEFKVGGAGSIAVAHVVKSAPDGYTIGITATANYINNPHVSDLPYDALTATTDIIALYQNTYGLSVKTSDPWNTYEDLIAYARKNPGKLKFGSIGSGSTQHIIMYRIAEKEGIKWNHIPFKNEGEVISACLGGHIDMTTQTPIATQGQIDAGKMRLLMVLTDGRWPALPKAPNMLDKGFGFHGVAYISILGPAGLPEPIRKRLEDAFTKAVKSPAFAEVIKKFGLDPRSLPGKEYSKLWRKEYDVSGKVIQAVGLGK